MCTVRQEAKIIEDLSKKGMKVPKLIRVEREQHRILMSYVEGEKMKDYLNRPDLAKEQVEAALKSMGNLVKEVHARGVIHGDLTTSNMIMQNGKDIFLIDFGLSYIKSTVEDRAVDLYVLERAFKSTHPQLEAQFDIILLQYEDIAVVQRLDVVKQRGRKKIAFG